MTWQLAQMNIGTMVGPTPLAFTFRQRFPAPGDAPGGELDPDGICVGRE